MADHKSLKAAAASTAEITNGSLDYLIVNGVYSDASLSKFQPSEFIGKEEILKTDMTRSLEVNVVGVIYSINAFLPLIRKGAVKKITVIATGMADTEMTTKHDIGGALTYSTIKAALVMVVAKYAVELKNEGIILLALCPGVVNTREVMRT
jgi:NAD(P)-dependent dehydrogenase (short-subunit alcohol dehydrogenase family)